MLFHTWTFVLFFLVVYAVYLAVRRTFLRLPWLLLASYVFYGWWNPLYLVLILWSTTIDYVAVLGMSRSRRRGAWLALSVVNNLGLLGFFKYGGFVAETVSAGLAQMGVPYAIPLPGVLLPVGISFYVFQSMSYTIDYYRVSRQRDYVTPFCQREYVTPDDDGLLGPVGAEEPRCHIGR